MPKPEFLEQTGYFGIIFRNPDYYTKSPEIKAELNERQKKAVGYLKANAKITTAEYMNLTTASSRTAKRDLLDLKNKKIIKFVGSLKTGHYALMAL